jgi:L-tyrosine isonitrile synthase
MLHRYQRVDDSVSTGDEDPCPPCVDCFLARQAKIARFIQQGEEVHFVIPAFPAKSPNKKKVLGALPDLGELMALNFLQSMCDYVGYFYSPGARVTICSDGHVFSDVVGVTDNAVTAYRESLMACIKAANLTSLDLFGLDDAFGSSDYPRLREILERDYAVSLHDLRNSVRTDAAARSMFNGIHRFMYEDALARGQNDGSSKTKLRNESKDAALETIRRSNAWSRVVAEQFPEAIRLSIHPQPPHSEKFGLRLMPTRDGWLTPWHGVVLDDGNTRYLAKRWDAEKLGASIVWRNGLPSHFVAPHLTLNS